MSNRVVTWAAVACLSAYASTAGAVALGEMRALSALGEPLKLQLALTDLAAVTLADVRVILAPADDYTRLGLIPPLGADQWQVSVQNGHVLINGVTAQQDPNLSFLVQVIWPGHIKVQQVTAVLLPASVAAAPGMSEPSLVALAPSNEVVTAVSGAASVSVVPEPATVASEVVPEKVAAAKAAEIEQITAEPVTGRVQAGDTLSQLAKAWELPQTSLSQRQQVLAESNPQLFVAGNINQLKRGALIRYPLVAGLTLPDSTQATAWLAARQQAAAQMASAENTASGSLDQPALSAQPATADAASNEEVTLTLVSPNSAKAGAQSAAEEVDAADQLGDLTARKNTLLAARATLQAELAALERNGGSQDARLKVLDARLAQLNAMGAEAKPAVAQPADVTNSIRPSLVAAGVGFFLALLLVMRRRAAAASAAANAARKAPVFVPENDYVAFEPLDALPTPAWSAAPVPVAATALAAIEISSADTEAADEEYDFLTDAESAALQTRIDLAQAYIDMQETELAKELLLTVISRGNTEQRTQAAHILNSLA